MHVLFRANCNLKVNCEEKIMGNFVFQEEGASNLALDLQSQIDETLEEINPRYVLELLDFPLGDEYRMKRAEGIQGVRNILWAVGGGGAAAISGGFTREDFMNEAFLRMTAAEQVGLTLFHIFWFLCNCSFHSFFSFPSLFFKGGPLRRNAK